jgi:hypothetical protein
MVIVTVAAFDPEQQKASWRDDDGIAAGLAVERDGGLVAHVMTPDLSLSSSAGPAFDTFQSLWR